MKVFSGPFKKELSLTFHPSSKLKIPRKKKKNQISLVSIICLLASKGHGTLIDIKNGHDGEEVVAQNK